MIEETKNSDQQAAGNIIIFHPEGWGEAEKFYFFAASTYALKPNETEVLKGILGHLNKYDVLFLLAKKLMPTIIDDSRELQQQGHSDCIRSREIAAIIETLYCELYSAIDCTRKVLKAIYPKYDGIPSDHTSRLFNNATDGKLDKRIPYPIIYALIEANADWFPELRRIRNAVVHSNVGTCGENEGRILYINETYKEKDNQLVIEDVFHSVSSYYNDINRFIGVVFQALNATLQDKEMNVLCGVFDGRIYERYVSPPKSQNIHSGRCKSFVWFEKEGAPICPLSSDCGAYKVVRESREKAKINH